MMATSSTCSIPQLGTSDDSNGARLHARPCGRAAAHVRDGGGEHGRLPKDALKEGELLPEGRLHLLPQWVVA